MVQDISASGTIVAIIASGTFPVGFTVTQSATDGDPLDFEDRTIAGFEKNMNGTGVRWANGTSVVGMTLSVIPGGADDNNLHLLYQANTARNGAIVQLDNINAVVTYPNGVIKTLFNGVLMEAPPGNSIAQNGRLKTNKYKFVFESD